MTLRLLTYLAPRLPKSLFEALARHLGRALGTEVALHLEGALRPVAALGPHPVQPLVARVGLPRTLREEVRAALLAIAGTDEVAIALAAAELSGFTPVDERDYAPLRAQLAALAPAG